MARKLLFTLFAVALASNSLEPAPVTVNWCPICVSLMEKALGDLESYVINGGVVGGCAELCSMLPDQLEDTVCDLVCDYVGIQIFAAGLKKVDIDPLYYCQLIDLCPEAQGGEATMLEFDVSPHSGPVGTDFTIDLVFNVTQPTGTGEIVLNIHMPAGEPLKDAIMNEGFRTGVEGTRFSVATNQKDKNGDNAFPAGTYEVTVKVCEGECGSSHPYSKTLFSSSFSFDITE